MQPQEQFEKMVLALHELAIAGNNEWVTWQKLSKKVHGTTDNVALCQAFADLPEYREYFAKTNTRVRLSALGFEKAAQLKARVPTVGGMAPHAVSAAVVRYAERLQPVFLPIRDVLPIRRVRDKWVQAVTVELSDGNLPTGTPVRVRPKDGGAWTYGKLVGQEPDAARLYVLTETEIGREQLPATLVVERAFLLAKLAERIGKNQQPPRLFQSLLGEASPTGDGLEADDAVRAARQLAKLPTPWARLLWGPPGSGKTFAIARYAAELLKANRNARLLLVAPSNLSVDVLTEELVAALDSAGMQQLVSDRSVMRYGYPRKQRILERPELLGSESVQVLANTIRRINSRLAKAERDRVAESELAQQRAELLSAQEELAEADKQHIGQARIVTTSTTLAFMPQSPVADHMWDAIAVDEATMVFPALCYQLAAMCRGSFLIAGDPRQLGPVTELKDELSDAEMEWVGRDIFEAVGISRGQGAQRHVQRNHALMVSITEQRRCATRIWNVVKHLYPGVRCTAPRALCLGESEMARLIHSHPVILLDVAGLAVSPCLPEGKSWVNRPSAALAVELVTTLKAELPKASVALIAPYRAQVRVLSRAIRAERAAAQGLADVEVGTIHQFQGSEADVVVFDVVDGYSRRRLSRLLKDDTGFRLANVAVTRAKAGIFILADAKWHASYTKRDDNPLLWDLLFTHAHRIRVYAEGQGYAAKQPPYESGCEAALGEAMRDIPELVCLVPQHRIEREDGSLISRADFAAPELLLAVYVDGAPWHLTPSGWRRDQRLRAELHELGWTILVFSASEAANNTQKCVDTVLATVRRLRSSPSHEQ